MFSAGSVAALALGTSVLWLYVAWSASHGGCCCNHRPIVGSLGKPRRRRRSSLLPAEAMGYSSSPDSRPRDRPPPASRLPTPCERVPGSAVPLNKQQHPLEGLFYTACCTPYPESPIQQVCKGPENLHFLPVPRCCSCLGTQFENHHGSACSKTRQCRLKTLLHYLPALSSQARTYLSVPRLPRL